MAWRVPKPSTLDKAGYTYNPFTTMDTFGQPSALNMLPVEARNLPIGADNTAIPALANPQLRKDLPQGSDTSKEWKGTLRQQAKDAMQMQASTAMLLFIGILGVALYVKPPGSL